MGVVPPPPLDTFFRKVQAYAFLPLSHAELFTSQVKGSCPCNPTWPTLDKEREFTPKWRRPAPMAEWSMRCEAQTAPKLVISSA